MSIGPARRRRHHPVTDGARGLSSPGSAMLKGVSAGPRATPDATARGPGQAGPEQAAGATEHDAEEAGAP